MPSETLQRELRYAWRSLRRSPGFFLVAILILAIGVAGTTAVFTIIKGSLLRPLPAVPQPERLVSVEQVQPTRRIAEVSYADYLDLREYAPSLKLAAYDGTSLKLEDSAGTTRVWVSYVSDNFFDVLGVRPLLGHLLTTTALDADADEEVVLGYDIWQRRFGASRDVLGKRVKLGETVFRVAGVAPPGFVGAMALHPMELWIRLARSNGRATGVFPDLDLRTRRVASTRVIGRLAPGKSIADAQRELSATAATLASIYPSNRGRDVIVLPGAGMTAQERVDSSRVPRLLAIAVALLLLIACANVASLSLVRGAARRRELATRLALGASHGTLVRQAVVEGAVLASVAGTAGIALARALVSSAALVDSVVSMDRMDLRLDWRVAAVALAVSTLTTLLVSSAPAFQIFRLSPAAVIKDGSGGAVGSRRGGQRTLVMAQFAASLILLVASAVLYTSFQRMLGQQSFVDPASISSIVLREPATMREPGKRIALFREVLNRARDEHAVAGATIATTIPPFEWSSHATVFRRGEEPAPVGIDGREFELGIRANMFVVWPGFFDVMRIGVVRGRALSESDDERSEPVVVLSRRLADALWPQQDPIGRYVAWPAPDGARRPALRVVGVAENTVGVGATEPQVSMFLPMTQQPSGDQTVLIARSRIAGTRLADVLRRAALSVDPAITVLGGETLSDRLASTVRPQRTATRWVAAFAVIALLLAAIGLYAVVAQSVWRRTREFAVRSAVGASSTDIAACVVRDAIQPALLGAAAGLAASLLVMRVLQSLFAGIQGIAAGPAMACVGALLVAVCVAAYAPARRAARLNPVDALRSD